MIALIVSKQVMQLQPNLESTEVKSVAGGGRTVMMGWCQLRLCKVNVACFQVLSEGFPLYASTDSEHIHDT